MAFVPDDALIEWCSVSAEDRSIFAAQTCKLFERESPRGFPEQKIVGLASAPTRLLAFAPNKKEVLDILLSRFTPSSWSGSLSAILRDRLQYLDEINPTGDQELKTHLDAVRSQFLARIEAEEGREEERERSATGTFE